MLQPTVSRASIACLALLLCALAARAQERMPERMPGLDTRTEVVRLGPDTAILTLPPGAVTGRPLAVVVLLPDAEGPGPRSRIYGQRLLENGLALLEPDFASSLAEDAPLPPAATRLRLTLAAIAADPRLDAGRVVLLGLGEGARAALLGLAEAPSPGRTALALLYPGCDAALTAAAARSTGPVLLLHGDADPANDQADCDRLAAAFPSPSAVRHRVLAGANYAWDAYDLVRPGGIARLQNPAAGGGRLWSRPDQMTTLIAADRVLGFVLGAVGR